MPLKQVPEQAAIIEENVSEYGIKIKNYEAAVIFEHNLGVRDFIDSTRAMLANSLLLSFLWRMVWK